MKTLFYSTLVFILTTVGTTLYGQKPAMTQEQYDKSLALFESQKKEHNNSYTFACVSSSHTGRWSKTFFVVEEGKVVERRLVTGDYEDKKNKQIIQWVEKEDSLGFHQQGKPVMTMDKLYEMGKSAIGKDATQQLKIPVLEEGGSAVEFIIHNYYDFNPEGFLSLIGFERDGCTDSCFEGYELSDLKWKKGRKNKRSKK